MEFSVPFVHAFTDCLLIFDKVLVEVLRLIVSRPFPAPTFVLN